MSDLTQKLKVAVLISGRGSNMLALVDACQKDPDFPAEIIAVLSDKPEAKGLELAGDKGIPTYAVDRKSYENKAAFEAALAHELAGLDYDCLCLAGFMRVLSSDFLMGLHDKMVLNIHPSLLPKYKGLHVHERVLEAGEQYSGCTVHFVTPEVDSGEIILQKQVPVQNDDTPDTLAARILEQEHIAYPEALRHIAQAD